MATPRVLRFDAEGRPLEFSVWLLRACRLLESQVQAHKTLWAHASSDLPEPADPAPLASDPAPADSDRYARERADATAWKSRDAAAYIALSSLLPESEETHFTQVRTASEFLTAIKARYATPTTVSLGHLFLPFLFPDLASFERTADLITHVHSLDSSYRTACTDAQLALLPPPMAITIHFIATSLPDGLASVRDALLLNHPSEITNEVLESALKDVESNLLLVASGSGVVPPPLFHGCTVPQLPTFTASLATAATDGASGGGGGDVASGGGGSAGAGGAPRAAAGDSPAAAGGGDARVRQPPTGLPAAGGGAAAWYLTQRQQQQQPLPSQQPQQQQPLPSQQPQQQQQQQQVSGQGSGQRQLQRGVVHPPCTYHVLTGARHSQPCGRSHPPGQCFAHLTDTVRLAYGVDGSAPDWLPLVQTYGPALWGMSASQLVDPFGTPHAMYAVVDSSASDSVYSSVVSLGASLAEVPIASVGTCVDTSPGAAPEDTSLSFTLDSRASPCFFRDCTTLTPLPMPVSVALADPTSGPVTTRYTTTLPCPAVPSGSLTGFHVPSFSRNLVGVRPLVSQHMAGLWSLHTSHWPPRTAAAAAAAAAATAAAAAAPAPAAAAAAATAAVAATAAATAPDPCHCPPSGSRVSPGCRISPGSCVWSGLPRVLSSLLPLLAPPCGPCVEGRLRATPHSSSLRPASEPFETLHLDVWSPASRPDLERESFFLVVLDDYSRYTTVFPLAKKSDVTSTLIRWLLTTADTRGRRVSCLHSDCGEVSPTNLWTGSPGAVSHFRVWGCLALVRDTSADKISPRAVSCMFLSFPEDSSDYTFYHPPLHRFFDSRDVHFDESVPYYIRYPCRGLPVPPAPLFLTSAPPRAPPVQPPPPGPAPSGVSHATPPLSVAPQVQPPSPQSSSQPTADRAGAGFRGEDPGGASSRGAGVGAESVPARGPGSGGAGVGAELVTAGDSSLRGAGVSGAVPRGTTTEGAPSAGPGEPGTDPVTSGGAGSGGGVSGSLESGPGATTAPDTTPPTHPYPTRHQARVRRAREEQLQLEREERELEWQQLELQRLEEEEEQQQPEQEKSQQQPQQQQQQQPPPPPVSGLWTLGLPSPSPPSPPSPPVSGPPLPLRDPCPVVFPPPLPPLSPPLSHTWPSRRSPRAHPSTPVPFTDLCTAL
ncbi:unnamed protein product, partial [Closterium sp. NIES-53]